MMELFMCIVNVLEIELSDDDANLASVLSGQKVRRRSSEAPRWTIIIDHVRVSNAGSLNLQISTLQVLT
jgi:hypothetical protein